MAKSTKFIPAPSDHLHHGATLVHIYPTGTGKGVCHLLGTAEIIIGRDPDCDISLDDGAVSRRHTAIRPQADGHAVVDLKSTNGTFVNDERVTICKLKDGDYLHIGASIYRYLSQGSVEAAYHEELYRLSILDGLTGAHNQRHFLEQLEKELARTSRHARPLGLIMIDLDHFKSVNDTMGHLAGDFALGEIAGCIRNAIRREDLFARYGGEEFVVLMPETIMPDAVKHAEQLRSLVEQCPLRFEEKSFQITISLGVTSADGTRPVTVQEFIQQADEKLYEAKRTGRNRVVS